MRRAELAIGELNGQWSVQWVDVPEGKNPKTIREVEWACLLSNVSDNIVFIHLLSLRNCNAD